MNTRKPSIERPWLKAYPAGAEQAELPQMTAYQYLRHKNKGNVNSVALVYGGKSTTYGEMFDRISATAKAFTAAGVKKGDIVTICLPNMPQAVFAFYALNKIGAMANMISPAFAPEHIAGCINITESALLIIFDKYYAMLKPLIDKTSVQRVVMVSDEEVNNKGGDNFWNDVNTGNDVTVEYVPDSSAVIVYSSGSTGAEKGIVLSNEAFVAMAAMYDIVLEQLRIQRNGTLSESCLVIIPFFTATSVNTTLNNCLSHGKTVILEPEYSTKIFVRRVLESEPNYTFTSTSFLQYLMYDDEVAGKDLSFLKYPNVGGESLDCGLERKLNEFFKTHNSVGKVVQGWGMNEFGATVTTVGMHKNDKGTGKPLSHIIVSAFDVDTDEELTYNQRGEIRVITPCRMLGFYKNPEATAAFFRKGKDGQIWGCSGDVGYIDEDGNVFVEGRATDFIVVNGEKIWLFDIENLLLQDRDVQLCEAVGISFDDIDVPVVHLVLNKGFIGDTSDVIRRLHASCSANLSANALPKGYKIHDGFAVKPSGKRDTVVLKRERGGFLQLVRDELREVSF